MNGEKACRNSKFIIGKIFDFTELFVVAICIVILFFSFFARLCRVDGNSMYSTLHDDEMLLVSNVAYTPKQGDIIVFHQTSDTYSRLNEAIVKRVIATEGQYVYIDYDTAKVYVSDDETFDETDLVEEDYDFIDNSAGIITSPYYAKDQKYYVPSGYVFVLGDNRNNSLDSRSNEIGLVDQRRIIGKVLLRLAPFGRFGTVN